MTMIDNGAQGAKRQSMKQDPLLILCQEVWDGRPKKIDPTGPAMVKRFRKALEEHEDYPDLLATILEYYWVNAVGRISKRPATEAEKAAATRERVARVERMKHEVTMRLDAKVQMMFLDMVMANGKTLRSCTRAELVKLKPRQDKVLQGIIDTLEHPSDVVGERFKTNDELRRFLKK